MEKAIFGTFFVCREGEEPEACSLLLVGYTVQCRKGRQDLSKTTREKCDSLLGNRDGSVHWSESKRGFDGYGRA